MFPPEDLVRLLHFEGLIEEIEKKTNFESRIKVTLRAIEGALPLKIPNDTKDSEISKIYKQEADILVRKEKGRFTSMVRALQLYSQSVATAETSSESLALAYANRSCVFFHLDRMEECIRDVDRALKLPYPNDRRYNLVRRKAKCLKKIGKLDADKICDEARLNIEAMNISDEKKELLEEKVISATKVPTYNYREKEEPKLDLPKFTPHKSIPSACSAINIAYNNNFGKHLVANRNINAGEILIVEKPYAAILTPHNYFTNCAHCFKRTLDSIPCKHCIYTMYCSKKCRSEAWKAYHDVECRIKGYLMNLQMTDLVALGLKLAILAVRESGSIGKLKKELEENEMCNDIIKKSLSKDGVYCSDKYKPIYNLVTHEKERSQYEILSATLNASLVLYYLFTSTSFLGGSLNKSIITLINNDEAAFFGKLLVLHFMIVQINEQLFYEIQPDNQHVHIGSTIGCVSSLLNHSCHPNVTICSALKNDTIEQVIFALHPIEEGCQITYDFNNHFAFVTKDKREEYMKDYFFKCLCIACKESWPLMNDLPSILRIVSEKDPKVEVARAIIRSFAHERSVIELGLRDYPGDKAKILTSLADSVKILYESTKKPTKEYFTLLTLFRDVFNTIHNHRVEVF